MSSRAFWKDIVCWVFTATAFGFSACNLDFSQDRLGTEVLDEVDVDGTIDAALDLPDGEELTQELTSDGPVELDELAVDLDQSEELPPLECASWCDLTCCSTDNRPVCVSLADNGEHCGACGVQCGASSRCSAGLCVCLEGFFDCDSARGCETPSRETDCGFCGDACTANDECIDGLCLPAGMVLIPEGNFLMGCNVVFDPDCAADESPRHEVTLSRYAIDRYEVTNAAYADCVANRGCTAVDGTNCLVLTAGAFALGTRQPTLEGPNQPMSCVNWTEANRYCTLMGKRLPSEAEWEKAARGGCELYTDCQNETPIYPWGNTAPECTQTAYITCAIERTADVGSFPSGASPYGVMDMAGNVWERVEDWYSAGYYSSSPANDPLGPASGSVGVVRGGGFWSLPVMLRSSARYAFAQPRGTSVGFRCAVSIP